MKVSMFFNYDSSTYYGGIINIIDAYLKNHTLFQRQNIEISTINPKISFSKNKIVSTVQKIFHLNKEMSYLKKEFKPEKDEIFHLHSSRGWILNNDLKLLKFVKKHYRIKTCLSIHFAGVSNILSNNSLVRKKQLKILNSFVDRIVVLPKQTLDEFVALGIDKNKLSLLYTFHSYESNILEKNISEGSVNLLFVGSIDERKGVFDLIEVLKTMQDYPIKCNICGGFATPAIKKLFFDHITDLKNINFLGYVNGIKKEDIFYQSDILILPSYGEGMPIVIMEALNFGCAVISTNVGAIGEIISEENGILFVPGDKKALKNAIIHLTTDKDNLNKICNVNLKKGKLFSIEKNITRLCDIYFMMN